MSSLVELLDDSRWVARWKAARVLGLMGPDAKDALPALEKAIQRKDQHSFERQFIPLSIAAIKFDTKTLIDCVEDKTKHSDNARFFAGELLAKIRPKGKHASCGAPEVCQEPRCQERFCDQSSVEKIITQMDTSFMDLVVARRSQTPFATS